MHLKYEALEQKLLFREGLRALRRNIILVLVTALTTVMTAYVGLQFVSEQYTTSAKLLVKLGRENAEVPLTVERGGVYTTGVRQEDINSEIQLLKSREIIEGVVDRIGIEKFNEIPVKPESFFGALKYHLKVAYRSLKGQIEECLIYLGLKKALSPKEKVILLLEKRVTVTREKDSDVIGVDVKLPSPPLTVAVANEMIALYFERRAAIRKSPPVKNLFLAQTASYEADLQNLETKKNAVRTRYSVSALSDQRKILLNRLQELKTNIDSSQYERKLIFDDRQILAIRDRNSELLPTPSDGLLPNLSVQSLKDRISELKIKHIALTGKFTNQTETVRSLEKEIARTTNLLVGNLDGRVSQLMKEAQQVEKELEKTNDAERELQRLDRAITLSEGNLTSSTKRSQEAILSEQLDEKRMTNISILSKPSFPITPVSPKKMLIMLSSVGVGLFAGAWFGFLREYTSDIIHAPSAMADIPGLSVLGTYRIRQKSEL